MTTARFFTEDGLIRAFEVSGHSGYAREGEDIVCAAVSAIAGSTVLGLSEVLGMKLACETDERQGRLAMTLEETPTRESQILLETAKRTLQSVAGDYPGHVRVICKKWRNS